MQNTELKKKKHFTFYKRRFRMFQALLSQDFVRFRKIIAYRKDKKAIKPYYKLGLVLKSTFEKSSTFSEQ